MARRPLRFRGWKNAPSGRKGDEDLIDRLPWPRREVELLPWWARSDQEGPPWRVLVPMLAAGVGVGVLITDWLGASVQIGGVAGLVAVAVTEALWLARAAPSAEDQRWSWFARLFFRRKRAAEPPA